MCLNTEGASECDGVWFVLSCGVDNCTLDTVMRSLSDVAMLVSCALLSQCHPSSNTLQPSSPSQAVLLHCQLFLLC